MVDVSYRLGGRRLHPCEFGQARLRADHTCDLADSPMDGPHWQRAFGHLFNTFATPCGMNGSRPAHCKTDDGEIYSQRIGIVASIALGSQQL